MINERTIELINCGLDGELNERQQEELEAALRESEVARAYQAKLMELNGVLANEPPVEPPPGLHANIVRQIKLPEPSFGWFGLPKAPGVMRYGLTAAPAE